MKRVLSFRVLASIGIVMLALAITAPRTQTQTPRIDEAKASFAVESNGFAEEFCASQIATVNGSQGPNSPLIEDDECNFATAAVEFTGPETVADGLGPIFNMAGCGECHFTPTLGGSSHINEKRAGTFLNGVFTDHPGGSLIQDRFVSGTGKIDPSFQETVTDPRTNVTALRASISIFGDGYVEAIANNTLQAIRDAQPSEMRGQLISVPVSERSGTNRFGRFGWKDQQATLLSFSADAYVNEMGITSPLQPVENTSNGRSVAAHDTVPVGHPNDPDDDGADVALFALFMRSLQAPPRDAVRAATQDARDGNAIFNSVGCDTCHTPTIVTASPGQQINGGALLVTRALGNKNIHPFSDYLLHDIGTGDGIVQNGGQATRNKLRTAPLWGLRTRGRFMHDGASISLTDAILRHDNQASSVTAKFRNLGTTSRAKLLAFLNSL